MTISNVWKEPVRELTETAMGLIIWVPVTMIILGQSWLFYKIFIPDWGWWQWWTLLAFIVGICVTGLETLLLMAIHETGETICNKLEQRGIHIRPKDRF